MLLSKACGRVLNWDGHCGSIAIVPSFAIVHPRHFLRFNAYRFLACHGYQKRLNFRNGLVSEEIGHQARTVVDCAVPTMHGTGVMHHAVGIEQEHSFDVTFRLLFSKSWQRLYGGECHLANGPG